MNTITAHIDHRIDHNQWCAGCHTFAAVTVTVAAITEAGVSRAERTACPRCGAGLNPKE